MKILAPPQSRGLRLDVFLARELGELTRSRIQSLNRAGAIRVDGRTDKAGYTLKGGEVVELDLEETRASPLTPFALPLKIYFEDDDMAVVEKPAGLTVHPGAGTRTPTLVHALLFHFKDLSSSFGVAERPGIVHRLDKWTSGLLIVAKNDRAHVRLSQAFQERRIEKTYLALVHGRLRKPEGEITMNIGRHASIRTRMAAQPAREDKAAARGRAAHTEYRVREDLGGFSLLETRIKTGRTHQIRVHLSAIGHPVAGDNVYGAAAYRRFRAACGGLYDAAERHFLHAAALRFAHPATGAILAFESAPPSDFSAVLEYLRSRAMTA